MANYPLWRGRALNINPLSSLLAANKYNCLMTTNVSLLNRTPQPVNPIKFNNSMSGMWKIWNRIKGMWLQRWASPD